MIINASSSFNTKEEDQDYVLWIHVDKKYIVKFDYNSMLMNKFGTTKVPMAIASGHIITMVWSYIAEALKNNESYFWDTRFKIKDICYIAVVDNTAKSPLQISKFAIKAILEQKYQ